MKKITKLVVNNALNEREDCYESAYYLYSIHRPHIADV